MKIDNHPTVLRHLAAGQTARGPHPLDADRLRRWPGSAAPTTPASWPSIAPSWTTSAPRSCACSPDEDAHQLRLPDEPGAGPQPGPLRRQPRVPPHDRGRQRGRLRDRGRAGGREASGPSARRWASPWRWTASPSKIWVVSHKPVAVAAGLGHMGIHRNVIHPKFGNFILLGTVLLDAEVDEQTGPSTTTPAWSASCASPPARSERSRTTASSTSRPAPPTTTASSWAASSTGSSRSPTAGRVRLPRPRRRRRDGLALAEPRLRAQLQGGLLPGGLPRGGGRHRPVPGRPEGLLHEVVKPLQEKEETVYVVPGSDAEEHVARRFPHKRLKHVGSGARPHTVRSFLAGLRTRSSGKPPRG